MFRFIDRNDELAFLRRQAARERASFVVIYGRRRTGKTELVLRFLREYQGIYYLADKKTYRENLRSFQRVAAEFLGDELFGVAEFSTWFDVFNALLNRVREKIVIVIDEFPYLLEKGVLEEFQKIWDMLLSRRKVMLIIVGSSISMMEKKVLSHSSPLYGRRTGQIQLMPLKFWNIRDFFPNYSFEDRLKVYAVLDGIPYYLLLFSQDLDFKENMLENYLHRLSPLYEDAEVLLRDELREVKRYFSILNAIASGKRNFTEIKNNVNMESNILARYLSILQSIGIVVDDRPVLQQKRVLRYRLLDNYFKFWFRYIYPNKWLIETGNGERLYKIIESTFQTYLGEIFEDVVRDVISHFTRQWDIVGKWWHKGEEIDIVAVNKRKKEALFAEVKWRNRKMGWAEYEELRRKSELVQGLEDYRKKYLLVNKGGFRDEDKLVEESVGLWDLKTLEKLVKGLE